MSVAYLAKKSSQKSEGFFLSFLSRQREREIPLILKLQSYRNVFFDWYFFIASVLGEEVFFICFIPFCCWNVSRQVALHLTFLLALSVGGGNMLKNFLQSPRPSPKIVWVNKGNPELDPGFPSTHTMTAFTIPWYLVIFYWESITTDTLLVSLVVLIWWSFSIAMSRIYNGHHFVVDVVGGFSLAIGILVVWTQYFRYFIDPIISDPSVVVPIAIIGLAAGLLYIHPPAQSASPAIAETALVFGTCTGTALAVWLHHYAQMTPGLGYKVQFTFMDLFADALALLAARFVVGAVVVGLVREVAKKVYLSLILYWHGKYRQSKKGIVYNRINYKHTEVDIILKYLTYTAVSFTVVGIVPHLCCMVGLFHVSDLVVFI